jgi:hypothetical protein
MSLRPKLPPKRDRSAEFSTFTPKPRAPAPAAYAALGVDWLRVDGGEAIPAPRMQKVQGRKRQDIRDSARGEPCLVRLPGCTGSAIWSHNRHQRAGKGRSIKSLDLNGCFCCPACDALYDGQRRDASLTREEIELAWYHAHAESLVVLARKGML